MQLTVVLADDHPAFLLGLRLGLEAAGLRVVATAHDGAEAIAACERWSPDAAVLDVRMPALDGIEACREIVAARRASCVLFLSTFDDANTRSAAIAAGARAFLPKSSSVDAIADVVRKLTAQPGLNLIDPPELPQLTARELEVLRLLGAGSTNKAIARELGIGVETVKDHCSALYGKLLVRDRTHAIVVARELGLL